MEGQEVLKTLDLGSEIAEQDKNLARYFINTTYVNDFVDNRKDIILGDKGAGKSAMLLGVTANKGTYNKLNSTKLVIATNLNGDPDFKRAFSIVDDAFSMQELIDAWKIYIINVLWKNYTELFDDGEDLKIYMESKKVITTEKGLLSKLKYALHRVKVKKAILYNKMNTNGNNETGVSLEFDEKVNTELDDSIDYNYIFNEIDSMLNENDSNIWILLDRLDDAFPDRNKKSIKILKALFCAYKDVSAYDCFKLKIFIRSDIFNDITEKGFTSLSHIVAKTMNPIKWDKEKIVSLFIERLLYNAEFKLLLDENSIDYEKMNEDTQQKIINIVLKNQIDVGKNNPDCIGWILNHIKDGNKIYTPRDFLQLIDKAREFQLDENRTKKPNENYLIGASAVRKAYKEVSKLKLTNQIYAEYPSYRAWIELFKNGKSIHNEDSLEILLGKQWKYRKDCLQSVGFLEEKGKTWCIPFLYRPVLGISQGKVKLN